MIRSVSASVVTASRRSSSVAAGSAKRTSAYIDLMNGFRVPAHMKGPLDTHWKIRDSDGYLLDYNGERSAVVHQWDRFYKEVVRFVDKLADDHRRAQKL